MHSFVSLPSSFVSLVDIRVIRIAPGVRGSVLLGGARSSALSCLEGFRSQRPTPLLVQPQGHRKGGDNGIQKYADTRHPHAGRGLRNPGALTERGTSFGMGGFFEKWPAPSDEGMPRVHGPRR